MTQDKAKKREKSVEKSPEERATELKTQYQSWKEKKERLLLTLYLEKDTKEEKGADTSAVQAVQKEIDDLKKAIKDKKERLDSRLLKLYSAGASAEAKKARRERTSQLCKLGELVERAGMGAWKPEVLLGMMAEQADYFATHPWMEEKWAERGREEFKKIQEQEQAQVETQEKEPQAQEHDTSPLA